MALEQPFNSMTKAEQTRARPVRSARRRRMAIELRAAGLTQEQIAEQMTRAGEKITTNAVSRIINDTLKKLAEEDKRDIEELRALELFRIDAALQVLWPKVRGGDLKAMREYRQFIALRASLQGTFSATKHEISGQIHHTLDPHDREEVRRLEEAFQASTYTLDDADFEEIEPGELPPPA